MTRGTRLGLVGIWLLSIGGGLIGPGRSPGCVASPAARSGAIAFGGYADPPNEQPDIYVVQLPGASVTDLTPDPYLEVYPSCSKY
jgi:hypothetical protein